MQNKVIKLTEALDLIKDGDTLAISAVGLIGYPDYLVQGLEKRFINKKSPCGLTLLAACSHALTNRHVGANRFAHPGFLNRIVCAHHRATDELSVLIDQNQLEAYALPQGIMNQLYRCIAAKQPGLVTGIGLGTYIDPRQEGGKLNSLAKEDIVELIKLGNKEWLLYKSCPVNIALFRGTTADEHGNITIEREANKLETLEIALAAKASNGRVIVQVERIVENYTLKPKDIVVPGVLVDAVVLTESPEVFHPQTGGLIYSPYISGELRTRHKVAVLKDDTISARDIICRRAVLEMKPGMVVNLGLGLGSWVASTAMNEGIGEDVTFTLELGVFGGSPLPPPNFGTSQNPISFISHPSMFDFYHGGGLDITFLGVAQVDSMGNINVSKYDNRAVGQGGFIDISQSTKKVIFCTYFNTKGLETSIADSIIKIKKEGNIPKFVKKVDQITFNGTLAREEEQEVLIITERAVFKLIKEGIELIEIAPGIDLDNDIVSKMEFKPLISKALKLMDKRIFTPGKMGIKEKYLNRQ